MNHCLREGILKRNGRGLDVKLRRYLMRLADRFAIGTAERVLKDVKSVL
jgi:hypothetical protein